MTSRAFGVAVLVAVVITLQPWLLAQTDLLDAARDGNVETLRRLLAANPNLEVTNANGDTPLILAAGRDHRDAADLLLTAGASLEAANKLGETALIAGAKGGHLQVVQLLITKEAALGAVTIAGSTALIVAVQGVGIDKSSEAEYREVAKLLIEKIRDVKILNAMNKDGVTALRAADSNRDTATYKLLRDAGATQ